ncbi:hypothetical protein H2198_001270 [Neophaeococcomyces mojaviensis]|uniref:Uncharacterized protein n=1 Tax=Neophaeococcomyces mojaviensis TaxID=3383035 RepID=A0ACC3AI31_9EURO|nr:hypothetical protein H2198_001270 [Knufia sp. JES_112]
MPRRARERYLVVSEEESHDDYSPIEVVPPPRRSRSRSRVVVQVTDDHVSSPQRERPTKAYHHHSYQQAYGAKYDQQERNVFIHNRLIVPQQRQRSSSTGAVPQPNFLPIYVIQKSSGEHLKHQRHQCDHYPDSDSEESNYRPRRRAHSRRRSPLRDKGEQISTETACKLARLELIESQKEIISAATAEKLAELKFLKEQEKKEDLSPAIAAKLAELEVLKRRREWEGEEATFIAKMEEKERREKEKRRQLILEYEKEKEEREKAEQEMIAKAEAKRQKKEAKIKAEKQRVLMEERQRVTNEAAEAKEERRRILAEERRKEEEAEEERKRILKEAEEKARIAKEKAEAERKRILLEEEERKKKEKEEAEALRKRILAEEEERVKKEKAKKKKEEDEFQARMREKFLRAGYSTDYIDDIMEEKKQLVRSSSQRNKENRLAIDIRRPTYIRVQVRDLLPETLDYYQIPWEYDRSDREYIIIKEYISHEFQQELFRHTEKIYKRRETKLITDGYTKETVTTLKPSNVYKDREQIYLVRRKSQGSKSPNRRSRMFT